MFYDGVFDNLEGMKVITEGEQGILSFVSSAIRAQSLVQVMLICLWYASNFESVHAISYLAKDYIPMKAAFKIKGPPAASVCVVR